MFRCSGFITGTYSEPRGRLFFVPASSRNSRTYQERIGLLPVSTRTFPSCSASQPENGACVSHLVVLSTHRHPAHPVPELIFSGFCTVIRPYTVRFSEVEYPTLRFGGFLRNRTSYSAVRCVFQKSEFLPCGSVL